MIILFNTKLRKKLLTYSFTHLEEQFYVRELSALIDEDPGNLSRELRKLAEEGLYISTVRGKEKFYSLNKRYPLFSELKTIIAKTEGVEGSLKDLVSKYRGIACAFIYGSYAKNKENKASDIDLVVIGEFLHNKFTHDIRSLEAKLNREINFTYYSKKEFAIEKRKVGGFLNLVLKEKKIVLKGKIE
jgi:predicted nucleotidyltransferase